MASGLIHQTLTNPIMMSQEILAFFAHGCAPQLGIAAGDQADRVAAGMSINAKECAKSHGFVFLSGSDYESQAGRIAADVLMGKLRLS